MFIKNYKEFLFEVRDKTPVPAGDKIEKSHKDGDHIGSDKELEKTIKDELEDVAEDCPRCGEHIDACECAEKDPWSTQVYHRVPPGDKKTAKPKQEFK
jgi:hypothetical protein